MNKLERMLIKHEGCVLNAYEDSVGVVSVGVGRNLDSLGISMDEAMFMLANDIDRCRKELSGAFSWFDKLDQVRQEVMIMLCFNLGLTRFRKFRLALGYMSCSDYENAAREFLRSKWSKQVGQRSEVLADMIVTGRYP